MVKNEKQESEKGLKEKSQRSLGYEEAKRSFASPVLEMLKSEKPISKWDMVEKLEKSERRIRRMIADVSQFYAVIATSDKEGYRLARKIDSMNDDERNLEKIEVEHQLAELKCRVKALKRRMKPLVAYLKVLEKRECPLTPEKKEEK